jgi:lauroyl/myristoyl acyltransferase
MQTILYYLARGLVGGVQCLPLSWLAWLGRGLGTLGWWVDRPRRRLVAENLRLCFGAEKSLAELRALARENFQRVGEAGLCALKLAALDGARLRQCVAIVGMEKVRGFQEGAPRNVVGALGHFGNFELFAHLGKFVPGWQPVTTYRALKQPGLNRLLLEQRQRAGCLAFERRFESDGLRAALHGPRVMLGLLADQHAARTGLWLPFFGRACSTTRAPALLALRYQMPLHTAICYRLGPGRWRIEIGDEIPTHAGDQARSLAEIMTDVNRAFEAAVRRDPANWFWMHRRWRTPPASPPAALSNRPTTK